MLERWVSGEGKGYADLVWRAVVDNETRAHFLRNNTYTDVVGLADFFGHRYYELLHDKSALEICANSEEADKIGGPLTFNYGGRLLSPNTLRYAKVLQDLKQLFPGYASFKSIAEIGVGYGGQARMISEDGRMNGTELEEYHLIDILPVCLLSRTYLDHFRMYPQCRYLTKSEIPRTGRWDLVISNYALSEFDDQLAREYLDNVLKRCRAGYLTMNSGLSDSGQWRHPVLSVETYLAELPNAVLLSEDPVTFPANYILVFGDHAAGLGVDLAEMRSREQRETEHYRKVLEIGRAQEAERRASEPRMHADAGTSPAKRSFVSRLRG